MADTCREVLFLAVEETIMNLTVFFGEHITVMENQMPILIIIIIFFIFAVRNVDDDDDDDDKDFLMFC